MNRSFVDVFVMRNRHVGAQRVDRTSQSDPQRLGV